MAILVSFVCLFFPYQFTRVILAAGLQFADLMLLVTSWIALMAYTTNGFIYAIVNHDFRGAFRRILCGGASINAIAVASY